jgi:hypothetical protein
MLVLSLASSLALAQVAAVEGPALNDLQSSRNMAMGGAFEALGYGGEVIVGNPAALSLYKRYQIEATGSWDVPQGYGFGSLAIADSTNPVAMGISYTFATYGGGDRRWAHLTNVSVAYAIADLIHIGITTRHQVIVGPKPANSITMNAGLLIRPVQWLSFGFSGHNLINVYNKDIRRYFVASVGLQILGQLTPAFDLKIDAFNDEQPARLSYHGGLGVARAPLVPRRARVADRRDLPDSRGLRVRRHRERRAQRHASLRVGRHRLVLFGQRRRPRVSPRDRRHQGSADLADAQAAALSRQGQVSAVLQNESVQVLPAVAQPPSVSHVSKHEYSQVFCALQSHRPGHLMGAFSCGQSQEVVHGPASVEGAQPARSSAATATSFFMKRKVKAAAAERRGSPRPPSRAP